MTNTINPSILCSEIYKDFLKYNKFFVILSDEAHGLVGATYNINYDGLANDTTDNLAHEIAHILATTYESAILPNTGLEVNDEGALFDLGLVDELIVIAYERVLCKHYRYKVNKLDLEDFVCTSENLVELCNFLGHKDISYKKVKNKIEFYTDNKKVDFSVILGIIEDNIEEISKVLNFTRLLYLWKLKSINWKRQLLLGENSVYT